MNTICKPTKRKIIFFKKALRSFFKSCISRSPSVIVDKHTSYSISGSLFWRNTVWLLAILFITSLYTTTVYSQNPGQASNFSIKGDTYSGAFNSISDDWFLGPSGIGNIDESNTATFLSITNAKTNQPFSARSPFNQYEIVNGYLLYDAIYARDYVNLSGTYDATTFAGSSGKNGDNPQTTWLVDNTGSPTASVDIMDAYAHLRREGTTVGSNMWLVTALATMGSTGTHYVDFELYATEMEVNGTGGFQNSGENSKGGHTAWEFDGSGNLTASGDLDIGFAYSGTSVSGVEVRIWTKRTDFNTVTPTTFSWGAEFDGAANDSEYGYAQIIIPVGGKYSAVNASSVTAPPWKAFNSGGNPSFTYEPGAFAEVGINMSALGIDPSLSSSNPCDAPFQKILIKSRSSSSFTSNLKDFVGPYQFLGSPILDSTISDPGPFLCEDTQLTLSPLNPYPGAYYVYSTNDGEFLDGTQEYIGENAIITKPGKYKLTSSPIAGCTETSYEINVYAYPCAVDDDMGETIENGAGVKIKVTINDEDRDNDIDDGTLNNGGLLQPTGGTLVINDNNGDITYIPNPDFYGPDSFEYQICDDQGLCDTALVTIMVLQDTDNDGVGDIYDLDNDNDGIPDTIECAVVAKPRISNPDFEDIDIVTSGLDGGPTDVANTIYGVWKGDASNIPDWETSDPSNHFEIWNNGHDYTSGTGHDNNGEAFSGVQWAEVNSSSNNSIYQDIVTTPGDVLQWSFAHRKRMFYKGSANEDIVSLQIGAPGSPVSQGTFSSHPLAIWTQHTGTYTVPPGQTVTRLNFAWIQSASGNSFSGNFVDDIQLYFVDQDCADTDGDGIPNYLDLDADNDGIPDVVEAGFPDANNDGLVDTNDYGINGLADNVETFDDSGILDVLPINTDEATDIGFGMYDFIDVDSDNDGITDTQEAFSDNLMYNDIGNDGQIDGFVDNDFNGWHDPIDAEATFPVRRNSDNDAIPNYLDLDSDNDGIPDTLEGNLDVPDADNNGIVGDGIPSDIDFDGLADTNDPDFSGNILSNGGFYQDTDGDGVNNTIDIDADNDGIIDNTEGSSTFSYIPPSGLDTDGDGLDDAYDVDNGGTAIGYLNIDGGMLPDYLDVDTDGDGLNDIRENHINNTTDADVLDTNNDGMVDVNLFTDADGDGLADVFDLINDTTNSLNATNNNQTPNTQPDVDPQNLGGDRDWREWYGDDTDQDFIPDYVDLDDDNDGILDTVEDSAANSDIDNDGIPNSLDLDSDGDGIPDHIDAGGTFDYDGSGMPGNGVLDNTEVDANGVPLLVGATGITPLDTDGDGLPNYLDLDSDNDGISDVIEAGGTDANGDGIYGPGTSNDFDSDGIADAIDLFDNTQGNLDVSLGGTPLSVLDSDGDGYQNFIDLDSDNDTIPDIVEGQSTIEYLAPLGVFLDTDGDGLNDIFDIHNGGTPIIPEDTDEDYTPDYLDLDSDGDFIYDIVEAGTANATADTNSNGRTNNPVGTNGLDNNFELLDNFVDPNGILDDTQTDNFPDADEDVLLGGDVDYRDTEFDDFDGDLIPNSIDLDDDNDGILDTEESNGMDPSMDSDSDGTPDYLDPDFCTLNVYGICNYLDIDNDGIPNHFDLDSDGDGCNDALEGYNSESADPDFDGIYGTGVPAVDANGLVISAGVTGSTYDTTPADTDTSLTSDFLESSVFVACQADLSLTKTVDNDTPQINDIVTFTITVTNDGPFDATGIKVKDILPSELTYNAAGSTIPASTTYNSSTGIWNLSSITLEVGTSIVLEIAATASFSCSLTTNVAEIINSDRFDFDSTPNNGVSTEDDYDTATLTVTDNTPPTWTSSLPVDGTYQCNSLPAPPPPATITASDNCGSATVTFTEVRTDGSCESYYTLTRTWTATDCCGLNSISHVQTLNVIDTVAPTASNTVPLSLQCFSDIPAADPSVVTGESDNCSSVVTVAFLSESDNGGLGTTASPYVLTRIYIVSDDCGNSITKSHTITVVDNTAPVVVTEASNSTVECDGLGNPGDVNTWLASNGGAVVTDNCTTITWSNNYAGITASCDAFGTVGYADVTFTATDSAGNTITTTATFTIVDTTNPTWSVAPSDMLSVECDLTTNADAFTDWLGSFSGTDGCGVATVTNNSTGLSDLCGGTGSETVTFTLTDECGNSITADATFTIQDTTDPVITVPADITVECDSIPAIGTATATDNCDANVDVVFASENRVDGSCPNNYTLFRIWAATDDCGNSVLGTQEITVIDTSAPTIDTAASDSTVECDGSGNTTALNAWLAANGGAAASDACGGVTWSNDYTALSDLCGATGSATVTFTATDACGNTSTTSAIFTIQDTTAPSIDTAASDQTVECDGSADPAGAFAAWLASNGGAVASDACGSVTWTNNSTGLSDLCGATGTETVTFTATDECGNATTTAATFTIQDTTAPSIDTAASDSTVECDGTADPAGAFAAWLAANGGAVASDACGSVTWTNNSTGLSDLCGATGTETVTFTATDECGNATPTTATFTIQDTTAPSIDTAASDSTVECDGTADPAGAFAAWLAANGGAVASDACGSVTWTNNSTGLSDLCGATGTETVTFTATDECGNATPTTATFTIQDTTDPTIDTAAADSTVECDGAGNTAALNAWLAANGGAAASDSCGGVTWSNDYTALSDLCGATGSATVTFTATDACGNTSTTSAIFTIQDTTAPSIDTAASDQTVECDGSADPAGAFAAWLASNGGAVASDACGSVTWTNNSTGLSDLCGATGTETVTFTATDECGNATTTAATFTIQDTTAPSIDTAASDSTVECDGTADPAGAFAAWLAANGGAVASDACGSVTWTNNSTGLSDLCGATGTETVTFTATDECGNATPTTATFTIQDTTAPSIDTAASDSTVECDGTADPAGAFAAWLAANGGAVASDACGSVTWTNNSTGLSDLCGATGTETVTFTATDECGNATPTTATFTIQDTTDPTIDTAAADSTVECDGAGNTAALNAWLAANGGAAASDSCGGVTWSNDYTALSDLCGATGSATVTFTATDDCGNTSTTSATFTIQDTTDPTIDTAAADSTVECDGAGNTAALNAWLAANGGAAASDSCGGVTWSNDYTALSDLCGATGSATVTFTATDDCGNTSTTSATFTIQDTIAPTIDTAAADSTVECDGAGNTAALNAWLAANGGAAASDSCGGVTWSNDYTALSDLCGATGSATVTFTATDDCGNTSTTSATFTIQDTTDPTIDTAAADSTVECDGAGNTAALNAWLAANGGAAASDSCGGVTWSNDYTALSDLCGATGSATVTFTATDDCGNTSTTSATFTIQDTIAPTIDTAAADSTVECDGAGNTAALNAWLAANGGAAASDSCGGVTWSNDYTALSDLCGATGSATVTFTATDDCGNTSTTSATFTIQDTTDPTIDTAAADSTVECDGAGNTAALNAWLAANGGAAASDSCGGVTWSNDYTALSDLCGATGSATVTFTATDDCGNTSTTSATFTIQDTTDPTIDTAAADSTVECDGAGNTAALNAWLAANGGAAASDSCGGVTWSNDYTALSDLCGATGSATVTFTATDDCGNTSTTSATFTIQDTIAPTIDTAAADSTVECDGAGNTAALNAWLAANGGAAASDSCGGVTWSNDYTALSDLCGATGSATVTFTATDDCGNTSTTSATFTIQDTTDPTIDTAAADSTVECDGAGNTAALNAWLAANGGAAASDSCGGVTWSNDYTALSDLCGATGSATVTFTATDDCGNTSTTSATFTIQDTIAPTIDTAAADSTVECDGAGNTAALNAWLAANGGAAASDSCGGVTWSNDYTALSDLCGATGSATVTFTATDDCGNTSTTSATFTIQDTTDPTIDTAAADSTVECDGAGNTAALNAWLAANGGAAASDSCGGVTWSNDYTALSDLCGATGSATVTFTATDDCGNTSTTSATFTIQDTTDPTIDTAAADSTVECDGAGNTAALNAWLAANGGAAASDSCGGVTWSNDYTALSDLCGATGSATVTFTATDDCGNTSTTSATFTIQDTTDPTIDTAAADSTVECDGAGNTAALNAWLAANGGAAASDSCGGVTWSNDYTALSDLCGATGSATVTFTATDDCGNTSTTSATFTIQDTTDPTIDTAAADSTVECDGAGNTAALNAWLAANGGAAASDSCGGVTWSNDYTALSDLCGATGSATVTFTATDDCGNTSTTSATFTIQDTIAPTIDTAAADSTVECDGAGNTAALNAWLAANGGAAASDSCGGVTWSNDYTALSDLCGATGSATVTFTATDDCGNTSTTSATFTIQDTTDPTIDTAAADSTVECDGAGNTAALNAWLAANGGAAASDSCGGVTWSNDYTALSDLCGATGSATVTFTATDDCGNTSTTSATFTIVDNTVPTFNEALPGDTTVECDSVPTADTLTATDNCGDATVTYNEVRTDSSCDSEYTLTRTWTATDECGLETIHTQTITVEDNTAPTFNETLPVDATVECDSVPAADTLTATDNCDASVTVTFNEVRTDGSCIYNYTLVRTWSVSDCSGNTTSHTQTLTVQDTTDPLITVPADVTVECDNIPAIGTATATDNCDADVDVVFASENRDDGSCPNNYTLYRIWAATDDCGNSVLGTQEITVIDTTNPTIDTAAADSTVECDGAGNTAALNAWLAANGGAAASDSCGGVTWSNDYTALSDLCGATGSATVTFTATDDCGNTSTTSATFTIQDTTDPTIDTAAADSTVECDGAGNTAALNAWLAANGGAAASDGCGGVTWSNDYTALSDLCGATGSATVTFTATDDCGNTSTTSATFTIQDTTDPTIDTAAADSTVECDGAGNTAALNAWLAANGGAAASDSCGGVTWSNDYTALSDLCGATGSATVTFTATDDCGNTSTTSATFTIEDTIAPTIDTAAADSTVECDGAGNTAALNAWLAANGGAAASDSCGGVTWSNDYTALSDLCGATGSATVTFTATDDCGNTSTTSATFTIEDTTVPTIDVEANDIMVECDGSGNSGAIQAWLDANGGASATETCGTVTWTNNYGGATSDCSDPIEVIFTATDECGNSITTTATYAIMDTTAPTIDTAAADSTVECDGAGNTAALNAWLAANGGASASDDCSAIAWTNNYTALSDDCGVTGSATVTFTVTDGCGNTNTTTATFTIEDNAVPTFNEALPSDTTVECDSVPTADTLTATDTCSNAVVTYNEVRTDSTCDSEYTLTRTWTATDECGIETTHTQTITVEDNAAPTFNETLPVDATVECDNVPAADTLTASDNCDATVTVSFTEILDGDADACPSEYTITRVWSVSDCAGNITTHTQTITVEDNAAPTFNETLPVDATVECDNVPAADTLTASDNCDATVTVSFTETLDGDADACPSEYTITRVWSVSDCAGNITTHTQTITVEDNAAPTFNETLPVDATVECDNVPAADTLTASDNCDATVTVSFTETLDGDADACPSEYTITRVWSVSDCAGNITTHTQTITVEDNAAPTFNETLPVDATVECDNVPAADTLTASDNCDATVTVSFTETLDGDADACPSEYTITRVWSVSDCAGNITTHTQTITVEDNAAPNFNETLPVDATVECDNVPAADTLTASDNCDATVTVSFTETLDGDADACPSEYTITRVWSVSDCAGNITTHTQTITVEDNAAPTFNETLPVDATVECDNVPAADTLTASDNCDATVTVSFTETLDGDADACPSEYTITRVWSVSDCAGNITTHTQTITVEDNAAPNFNETLPVDATVECDNVPAADTLTASDNCDATVTVSFTETLDGDADACPSEYTITRVWSVSDCAGNITTHTQTITVEDNAAPNFNETLPVDATVECDNVPAADTLTASDNCDATVTVSFTETLDGDADACPSEYTITRVWSVSDCAGNITTHTQTITVEDNAAPTFNETLPVDATVECDNVPAADTLTASDNCDATVTVSFTETLDGDADACPSEYTITRVWSVSDCAGNITTHTQTITVEDNAAPTFNETLPVDATVECDNVPAADTLTASDNCDATVTVSFTETLDGDADACPSEYTITRVWSVSDCAGNITTHTQTITVEDNAAPTFNETLPVDATVECDNVPAADTLTASDNCDATVTVSFTETLDGDADACPSEYTITRVWSVSDCAGNITTHTQTITVEDNAAPTFNETLPVDATVECDNVPAADTLTASDNCDVSVNVTYNEVRTDGSCDSEYTLARTWTVSDCAGNITTHTQTITVEDNAAPTFNETLPVDATVECDNVPAADTLTASDNCGTAIVTFSETSATGSCPGAYVLTRTWTATDECGNTTVHTQTVTVEDTIAPTFNETLPNDASEECDYFPKAPTLTASDNCGTATVTFAETTTEGSCPSGYILTRTWTATDACGNSTTHTQTITFEDSTAPTFNESLPADETVECDAVAAAVTLTADDNCGIAEVTFTETSAEGSCPSSYVLTRTWTATDECGNTTIHTQTVTVEDNTAPTFNETLPIDETVECEVLTDAITLTADDNCGTTEVTFIETSAEGSCPGAFVLTRAWTATDECGNATTHTQTVTVEDNTAPTFNETLPVDATVECDDVADAATLTANDSCSTAVITFTETTVDGACQGAYVLTRTWTATDECGNSTTHTQTLSVVDTTPPAPTTDFETEIFVTCSNIPEPSGLEFADACSAGINAEFEEASTYDGSNNDYEIYRTWFVSDICGNVGKYIQTIFVSIESNVEGLSTDLCNEDDVQFDLFNLLNGSYETDGIWSVETGNASISGSFFNPYELDLGTYTFNYVVDQGACPSETIVTININEDCAVLPCGDADEVIISKAVTANDDQWNEYFTVTGIEGCGFTVEVQIYNRWGALIYESKDYQNNWNAFVHGNSIGGSDKVPTGTYYYIISLKGSGLKPFAGPIYVSTN